MTRREMFRVAKGRLHVLRGTVGVAGALLIICTVACTPPAQEPSTGSALPESREAASRTGEDTTEGGKTMEFKISSPAFEQDTFIPKKYTGDGPDVSPPLNWTEPPVGTKSFALICDDPDAPMGTWVHWVIYEIGADARELQENVAKTDTLPTGVRQGTNDFRKVGYGGPAPPPGPAHRYYFKLYALDTELPLAAGARKNDLLKAMEGHILDQAELMGRYKR